MFVDGLFASLEVDQSPALADHSESEYLVSTLNVPEAENLAGLEQDEVTEEELDDETTPAPSNKPKTLRETSKWQYMTIFASFALMVSLGVYSMTATEVTRQLSSLLKQEWKMIQILLMCD